MSSYFSDARKRTLSSDTTESSENEECREGEISPAYNYFGNDRFGFAEPQPKAARMESWSSAKDEPSEEETDHGAHDRNQNENHNDDDDDDDDNQPQSSKGQYSNFAQKLMANMGYVEGKGLGKREQGRVDIIESSKQRGRRGLGLQLTGLEADNQANWKVDEEEEEFPEPSWMPPCNFQPLNHDEMRNWIKIGPRKETIDDEAEFCDQSVIAGILSGKNVFDMLGTDEFLKARTRSNPHETIRGAIFQNRAAMKMAEFDATFDFMFTDPKDEFGRSLVDGNSLLYFADICAGPGGFSEYVLWRKKWHSKGFGLTLRAEGANDFKIRDFLAGSPETFEPHYGVGGYEGDGDIFREDNLVEFRKFVIENSDNKGVHFVMADGGFSVEGQENIQEILSKQLYLCQFLCALSVLRPGGHFMCKLFDIFTPFSVGLIYLMFRAFERVSIHKPVTSRPANSERYIVCKSKLADTESIHDYMFEINEKINKLKRSGNDINEVVPLHIMKDDSDFYDYIYESNNRLGIRQSKALLKLKTYVQNTELSHPNQGEVRKRCLERWKIPDAARAAVNRSDPEDRYAYLIKNININVAIETLTRRTMKQSLSNILDYKFTISGGTRIYLLSLGRFHIFKWEPRNVYSGPYWRRIDDARFELPRDTLIEAELVEEYKGEGRGQRRLQAVHIVDAIYLGGDFVADKPLMDRMRLIEVFTKAISKPSRPSMTAVRSKKTYRLYDVNQEVFERMTSHQMKSRTEQKMCLDVTNDRYFVPCGLQFFRCVKDPWSLNHSKSQRKLYFFNRRTGESRFESPGIDSVANYEYCLRNRLFWNWQGSDEISKEEFLDFIRAHSRRIGMT